MDGAMRTPLFQIEDILKAFQRKKVLARDELLQAAGCSAMTAWRLLRQHGYFTSYNLNARYYTIVGIPHFDEHGLWAHRKVRFSKWGSLTKTIIGLIEDSPAGMSAQQLEELLHVKDVKPSLTRLTREKTLTREKIDRRYVYFPLQTASRRKQQAQRKKETEAARAAGPLPPLEHIIGLLVEIIQRPQSTPRQWARRLRQRGIPMGTQDIQRVLDHYQIEPKKGLLSF
jgi:hypothetical protein